MKLSPSKGYRLHHLRLSLIALLTCGMSFSLYSQSIRNLTLGPCDLHAISYCGALEVLEEQGALAFVERVSGEKGGSIVATLLAIGYSAVEVSDIMVYTDFSLFIDADEQNSSEDALLTFENDIWKGWLESHVAKKLGSSETTFSELHVSRPGNGLFDLFVLATSANGEMISYSHETHPDLKIVEAVFLACKNMNCSIEAAKKMKQVDENEAIEVEALFDNPKYYSGITVQAFEEGFVNSQTLCLRMTINLEQEDDVLETFDTTRVLSIPVDYIEDGEQLFMFPLGKSELLNEGREAAMEYLAIN
jgi:hypothetical protein